MGKDENKAKLNAANRIKQIQKAKMPKKKKVINLSKLFSSFFSRFGLIVFTVITLCGLIYAVVTLNEIMQQPYASSSGIGTTPGGTSSSGDLITIDQATIDNFNALKPSNENTNQELPSGRINPFAE